MLSQVFIDKFSAIAKAPDPDLATAALLIARLEYPRLEASRYLDQLDRLGQHALERLGPATDTTGDSRLDRVRALNEYLFEEEGFAGNEQRYDDPRNSFLNTVLERRTGIPITLALVYMEVARRASVAIEGVNFPGHFLVRLRQEPSLHAEPDVIVDPFNRGAILTEHDCQRLLREHAGQDADFEPRLLVGASKPQILIRMLVNLKRIYVRMRSFPQGRAVTELLLSLNPSAMTELRDRGLLAYHLNDFPAALRDLETYLRYTSHPDTKRSDASSDLVEVWEHVKTLRRRVASLN